jgi:hypothetical protein
MEKRIVCSLATWPPRIKYVSTCIKSLLNQTVKPDVIMLNCSKLEFPNMFKDFPEELINLIASDKSIRVAFEDQNIGPFRKEIIPAYQFYGQNYILFTADDDYNYAPEYIETMLKKLGNYDYYCSEKSVCGGRYCIRGELFLPMFWNRLNMDIVNTGLNDTWLDAYLRMISAIGLCDSDDNLRAMIHKTPNAETDSPNSERVGGYTEELVNRAILLSIKALTQWR